MNAAPVRIQAVPERNIRRMILGDDALGGVLDVFDLSVGQPMEILLIPFQVIEFSFPVNRIESIGRVDMGAMTHFYRLSDSRWVLHSADLVSYLASLRSTSIPRWMVASGAA